MCVFVCVCVCVCVLVFVCVSHIHRRGGGECALVRVRVWCIKDICTGLSSLCVTKLSRARHLVNCLFSTIFWLDFV